MGGALSQTGAGEVVGGILADAVSGLSNPYLIGLVFFVVPFLLTQIMMNRTVMLIFIPIAILACKSMGANPIVQKWWDYMADIMEVNADNSPVTIPLPEVFHMD